MKRLFVLCLLLVLVSCGDREDYFSHTRVLSVTFTKGDFVCDGVLTADKERVVFEPRTPEGFSVTFTDEGSRVDYLGLTFTDTAEQTRFASLPELVRSGRIKYKDGEPVLVEYGDSRLTDIKEIKDYE